MCTSAPPQVCIWQSPSSSSWWLTTTLFWLSTVTGTHQVPHFQTIMVFILPFLYMHWFSSTMIAFVHVNRLSSRSFFTCLYMYHTSCFSPWLSFTTQTCDIFLSGLHPLSYFEGSLKMSSHSQTLVFVCFPHLFHIHFCLILLSQALHQNCSLPINVSSLAKNFPGTCIKFIPLDNLGCFWLEMIS